MTKSITLFMENDKGEDVEKVFHQPSRIKGKAVRIGLLLGEKMEQIGKKDEEGNVLYTELDVLDEMLQYVAEYGYNNKFTADELENGLDARDLFEALSEEVQAIIKRPDVAAEGKSTKTTQNSSRKTSPTKTNEKA